MRETPAELAVLLLDWIPSTRAEAPHAGDDDIERQNGRGTEAFSHEMLVDPQLDPQAVGSRQGVKRAVEE
jgi:hypothetical protein